MAAFPGEQFQAYFCSIIRRTSAGDLLRLFWSYNTKRRLWEPGFLAETYYNAELSRPRNLYLERGHKRLSCPKCLFQIRCKENTWRKSQRHLHFLFRKRMWCVRVCVFWVEGVCIAGGEGAHCTLPGCNDSWPRKHKRSSITPSPLFWWRERSMHLDAFPFAPRNLQHILNMILSLNVLWVFDADVCDRNLWSFLYWTGQNSGLITATMASSPLLLVLHFSMSLLYAPFGLWPRLPTSQPLLHGQLTLCSVSHGTWGCLHIPQKARVT